MNNRISPDLLILDDEYVNNLATDWYFLTIHFNAGKNQSNELANELIERGLLLKRYLNHGGHTYLEPMNVCVDTETFFDLWLDADGDIQTGELYSNED